MFSSMPGSQARTMLGNDAGKQCNGVRLLTTVVPFGSAATFWANWCQLRELTQHAAGPLQERAPSTLLHTALHVTSMRAQYACTTGHAISCGHAHCGLAWLALAGLRDSSRPPFFDQLASQMHAPLLHISSYSTALKPQHAV